MEESHSHRPVLHPAAVEVVLAAMRSGQPLGDHPLRDFLTVRNRVNVPYALAGDTAVEVAIFDYLADLILKHLTAARLEHRLPPPDRSGSDRALERDFQQNNQELEIWSVLFHRYLCVQHDLLMQDIAERVNQTVRTVRRRLNVGLLRLTHILIREEQEARRLYTEQRLRLALPSVHSPWLVNYDVLTAPVLHFLEYGQSPIHIVLHGPPGCGKTAVAQAVAHELVNRHALEDLVWLDCTRDAADIVLEIAHRVSIPLHDTPNIIAALRAYLFRYKVLIVLDGAEALLRDAHNTENVLAILDSARVLLTSQIGMPEHLWYYKVSVPPLTRPEAHTFLEHLAERDNPAGQHWLDRFDTIWSAVGGNPLALKMVWTASRSLPPDGVLVASHIPHVYAHVWEQLNRDEQLMWVLALLFPRNMIPHADLVTLSGLPERYANYCLTRLVDAALLDVQNDEVWCYRLEPVCATFLIDLVRHNTLLDAPLKGYVREAVQNRIQQLLAVPNAAHALHVLYLIADLDFDIALHWEAAELLAPQITDAGDWAAWSGTLKQLAGRLLLSTQTAWLDRMQGVAQRWLGQLDSARRYLEHALAVYPEQSNDHMDCLVELSVVQRYQGEWDTAHHQLRDALAYYEEHDDLQGIARCVNDLGHMALDAGHPAQALAWLGRLADWTARDWGLASQAYLALEQYDRALEAAEQALELFPQQHPNHARTLVTLGRIFDKLDQPAAAVRYLLSAVNTLEQYKDTLGYARASNNLAVAYIHLAVDEQQQYDDASIMREVCDLLLHARDIQSHSGDGLGLAVTQRNLAWLNDLGICTADERGVH